MRYFYKYFLLIILTFFTYIEINSQSITWRQSYRNLGHPDFGGIHDIEQTNDGGYIAVGQVRLTSYIQMFAMGISPYGDSLWYKTYDFLRALKIVKLNDGNFLMVNGYSELVKINPVGDTIWTKRRYKKDPLNFWQLRYFNNEFYICGSTGHPDRPFLLKVDSLGNDILYKEYDYYEWSSAVEDFIINENDIIIYGRNFTSPAIRFLIKTDLDGKLVWLRNYMPGLDIHVSGTSMIKFPFEESIMIGGGGVVDGRYGAGLMKMDTSGNVIWQRAYDPPAPFFGLIEFLLNDINGGVISCGVASRDSIEWWANTSRLIKFDYNGNELWRKQYGFEDEHLSPRCFKQTSDSGYIFGGNMSDPVYNFHIVKTDKFGDAPVSISNNSDILPSDIKLYQNYPNPFNPSTIISYELPAAGEVKLKIFDVSGKQITTLVNSAQLPGRYEIIFKAGDLSSGAYFYHLEVNANKQKYSKTKRMIYLK